MAKTTLRALAAAVLTTAALLLAAPASADEEHDHGTHDPDAPVITVGPKPSDDPDAHDDHADHEETPAPAPDAGHDDHGTTTTDDAGHDDHGQLPDSVSPEVKTLVLSGFAGVNVAVVLGAYLVRRGGPDPDPRKRAKSKAAR